GAGAGAGAGAGSSSPHPVIAVLKISINTSNTLEIISILCFISLPPYKMKCLFSVYEQYLTLFISFVYLLQFWSVLLMIG
ncbi:MAG: hypothetical protein KAW90_00135, partial [Dehalococcoidales bacterium]|nr:hypothetical protein [Dehalococcoidales bacterium]